MYPKATPRIFKFYFNSRKQWAHVYVWPVSPRTFKKYFGSNWGAFWYDKIYRQGNIGTFHLCKGRVREDLIAHELFHMFVAWMKARRIQTIHDRNEEELAWSFDEMTRRFIRACKRHKEYNPL